MTTYEDQAIALDDAGIAIKSYHLPGRPRHIRYADIVDVELIPLGFGTGRHQLVGIGPLRPRHYFHWDRHRAAKSHAISLDLGKTLRTAITPDDPERVRDIIRNRIERG